MKKIICIVIALIMSFSPFAAVSAAGTNSGPSIVKIAANFNNTVVLKSDGTLWGCGDNSYGQLGDMKTYGKYIYSMTKLKDFSEIDDVAIGYSNLLVIKHDGTAWSLGKYNAEKQYDSKDDNDLSPYWTLTPKKLTGVVKANNIMAGEYFGLIRHSDASVSSVQLEKLQVRKMSNVKTTGQLYATKKTGYFMDNDNKVWAWNGYNFEAYNMKDFPYFISIAESKKQTFIVKKDGTVWGWVSNPANAVQVQDLKNINKIVAMGDSKIAALSNEGHVWVISVDNLKATEVKGFEKIKDIAAGASHIVGLSREGKLYAYGDNSFGQLGIGNAYFSGTPQQIPDMKDAVTGAGSKSFAAILKNDGTVWTWGSNSFGQLGDGTKVSKYSPVKVKDLSNVTAIALGEYHGMALKSDGTVWTWGSNSYGQIGDDSLIDRSAPVKVEGLSDIVAISAGSTFSVALKKDGRMYSWGYSSYGRTDKKEDINMRLPFLIRELGSITSISAGYDHIVALRRDTAIWGWGGDVYGQLGISEEDEDEVQIPDRLNRPSNIIQTYAGKYYSMFLKNDGSMYAWGNNEDGRLGVDSYRATSGGLKIKDIPDLKQLCIGQTHSFAITHGGIVWAWGSDRYSQLGDNDTVSKHSPIRITALSNVKTLVPCDGYTIAIKNDGTVWTWGYSADGLLVTGKKTSVFQSSATECQFK